MIDWACVSTKVPFRTGWKARLSLVMMVTGNEADATPRDSRLAVQGISSTKGTSGYQYVDSPTDSRQPDSLACIESTRKRFRNSVGRGCWWQQVGGDGGQQGHKRCPRGDYRYLPKMSGVGVRVGRARVVETRRPGREVSFKVMVGQIFCKWFPVAPPSMTLTYLAPRPTIPDPGRAGCAVEVRSPHFNCRSTWKSLFSPTQLEPVKHKALPFRL
ncbi:hypothetical protein QBC41DRAFT_58547 [Cercophora samala]|uniref:Uncharacterized protein n=1 Tax=Cercophora samala TaxID=330535 RepID=A0AA40DEJ2_9PEZI|nr:hypothetical protein QBC41DRAFT_58547 [Cercophora samala]